MNLKTAWQRRALLALVWAGALLLGARVSPAATLVDTRPIINGTAVPSCGWPTTVAVVQGSLLCTGTLVHPRVVIQAAHCKAGVKQVHFGIDKDAPERTVKASCSVNPAFTDNFGAGVDFGVCVLAEPVLDVPIVPILMGCELGQLRVGKSAVLVGFGAAGTGSERKKRQITLPIVSLGKEAVIGSPLGSACLGDSGGPAFLELEDGSWRVFGVTSHGPPGCYGNTNYCLMHRGMGFFERTLAAEGIDITPCYTPGGTWRPGPDCGASAPTQPAADNGDWATGCQDGPSIDSQVCAAGAAGMGGVAGADGAAGSGGTAGSGAAVDDGCSCRSAGVSERASLGGVALAGLLVAAQRRRCGKHATLTSG